MKTKTKATTEAISPFFIVSDVERSTAFYCEKLGFATTFKESDPDPFFAIVRRDGAQLSRTARRRRRLSNTNGY
ncbi:MAG: VOC family protein [Vulcanimicrobiaceae bacterium]|jgi:catechol 2,3-dioxygenase-like lactoylglutathione lyase family enzyme